VTGEPLAEVFDGTSDLGIFHNVVLFFKRFKISIVTTHTGIVTH
jgi:hypothetical protein